MSASGITEKKIQNKRFFKTELAILITYHSFKGHPSTKLLTRRAHISRSTFYRHHRGVQEIPRDYEEFLLTMYRKSIKKYCRRDDFDLRRFFLHFLIFISCHKVYFATLFRENHKEIIIKMMNTPKTLILSEWRLSGDVNKIYSIYANEVLGVVETWAKHNFSKNRLEKSLNDILFLTNSARSRLLPLLEQKS